MSRHRMHAGGSFQVGSAPAAHSLPDDMHMHGGRPPQGLARQPCRPAPSPVCLVHNAARRERAAEAVEQHLHHKGGGIEVGKGDEDQVLRGRRGAGRWVRVKACANFTVWAKEAISGADCTQSDVSALNTSMPPLLSAAAP